MLCLATAMIDCGYGTIAAAILAARKLSQYEGRGTSSRDFQRHRGLNSLGGRNSERSTGDGRWSERNSEMINRHVTGTESLDMNLVFHRATWFVMVCIVCSGVVPGCWSSEIPKGYSKSVQSLFHEAEAASARPILIKQVPSSSTQAFQGATDMQPDRVAIAVTAGISRDYDDAVLAHELLHVILNVKRFAAGGDLTSSGSQDPQVKGLSLGMRFVNSCFPDELIDRESVKRGLKPQLLLDRQIQLTIEGTSQLTTDQEES